MWKRIVDFKPRILYSFKEMQAYLGENNIPNNKHQAGRWLVANGWTKVYKRITYKNSAYYYKDDENGNNVELEFKDESNINTSTQVVKK